MRTPEQKNLLNTSFTIDLSTVDKKVDKLVKYLKNCEIDLKDDGKDFINFHPTYKTTIESLDRRKYKESLSTLVYNIYLDRFLETKSKLISQKIMTYQDAPIPEPLDDFGSRFDAFAATNTDPNNAVLIALGTKPYKNLKVDIFEESEIRTYLENVASASYDFNNLNFLLTKLDSITNSYLSINSPVSINYCNDLRNEIITIKSNVASSDSQEVFVYNLLEKIPSLKTADNLIFAYVESTSETSKKKIFPADAEIDVFHYYPMEDVSSIVGEKLLKDEIENNDVEYELKIIESARIKLLDYIIRTEIKKAIQEKLSSISFLSDFKSKYDRYNFLEEKLYSNSQSINVKKENLFFRITFLREEEQLLLEKNEQLTSNLNIEFVNKQFLKFESPFGSIDRSNKFVAIIGGSDLVENASAFHFFDPTILSILSDINYIDNNIVEIDPFYCPTPQSLQPNTIIQREKYNSNQLILESSPLSKDKNLVNSRPNAFTFINFPNLYFIPNKFPDALSFYESVNAKLTFNKANNLIVQNSKYYYQSSADTPSAKLIRDPNSNRLFQKALLNNGFNGLYTAKSDSFSDPVSIQAAIERLRKTTDALASDAVNEIQDIVFARTNISCLLKEFQTCFLPKIGNCRDILRGFRFSELESMLNKAFPESLYTELYKGINQFKINNLKDEREKRLLQEIRDLETAIRENERKRIVFSELDKRTDPGQAFDIADRAMPAGSEGDISLQESYERKLKQYRDLKLNQESSQITELDKVRARKEMDLDELKFIDDFLDLLENDYGINVDILCSIVDLFNISPMFGAIQLPRLPEFDIYLELKLNLDLSIVKIIFDSFVAFIIKILQELLTCGGIKNLLNAALTGEASGSMTGAAFAAANQLARGKFDLDDFVSSNPQVDPVAYTKSFINISKTIKPPLTVQETSQLDMRVDTPIGRMDTTSRTKSLLVLNVATHSATTETEIQQSLSLLISGLSRVMTADSFMRLFHKPMKEDLNQVEQFIKQYMTELSYLLTPGTLSGIFTYLGNITGLDSVRQEMMALSTFYTSNSLGTRNVECLDPSIPVINSTPDDSEDLEQATNASQNLDNIRIDSIDRYRNLLQDLLSSSPETLKNKIDDSIFKPLLIGKLPNGKAIESVEKAKSEIIDSNLQNISKKFKAGCNEYYSNLVCKKPFKRKVPKFLKQDDSTEQYENSEYKDLVNKGGYKEGEAPDPIEIEETKYVYGALFTDSFNVSSKTLSINSTPEELKITLTGSKGYPSVREKEANASSDGSSWKIQSIISNNKNNITIYEGNSIEQNNIKFTFDIKNQNINTNSINEQILDSRQEFNKILIDSITGSLNLGNSLIEKSINLQTFENKFEEYSSNSYNEFLSLIYEKITNVISEDGLLKPINLDTLQKEKYITGIKNGLDTILPGLSLALEGNSLPAIVSPNVDTPLKYINFCPKPTKKQKNAKVDPALFGALELKEFISETMNKRSQELVNLNTLEDMLKDKDNLLKFSTIDGLYLTLIRTACTEMSLRALFPLRVFNYNKKLIDDLLLPTYIAETIQKEIIYVSKTLNRASLVELTQKHVSYIHDFVFQDELDKPENQKLFYKIKQLKKEIVMLEEDRQIVNSYLGKLYVESVNNSNIEYKNKLDNFLSCINTEIKNKYNEILLLQTRNIAYNELVVIFDKLSYLTSTNERVKQDLGTACKDIDQNLSDKEFLSVLIPELLIKSDLKQVHTTYTTLDNFIEMQNKRYDSGSNLIMEHYINVPTVKNQYTSLRNKQTEIGCYGPQPFYKFKKLLEEGIPHYEYDRRNLNDYFAQDLTYEMRLIYVPSTNLQDRTSILFDPILNNVRGMGIVNENIQKLINDHKYALLLIDDLYSVNNFEKTYVVPFIGKEYKDYQGDIKRKFGVINEFPLIKESQSLYSAGIVNVSDVLQILPSLEAGTSNQLTDLLKAKISCNEQLKKIYSIFTNENLLSNLTILSSTQILSDDKIVAPFRSVRKEIINNIFTKMISIYNRDDLEDFFEKMSSIEYFKDFNAAEMAKISLKAAIYVLQYYCQMTDPNISLALLIRNAVKLSLATASQLPNPFGGPTIPSELPLPLSPLAIYSMAQLPVTVFGIPPVGIGVGAPLTIPGMVLLGADLLLLSLEFSENLDSNAENDKIKEELKNYCFDLSGYKKYGV